MATSQIVSEQKPKRGRKPKPESVSMQDVISLVRGMNESMLANVAEVVREMKKPYVNEEAMAREKREAAKTKRDMEQSRAIEAMAQSRCSHKYKKSGTWAITAVHNFPDRQTRGRCNLCRLNIEPDHWEIAYNKDDPAGTPFKVPAHPLYHVVREIEADTAYQLVG